MDSILSHELFRYWNLPASLLALALIALITRTGKWLVFKHPALAQMRDLNREKDKEKWAQEKYPPIVRANQRVGLWLNLTFFILVLPLCITVETQSILTILLDCFVILMFYDFFYYLAHRFWFHGNGAMRRIHAVHHQARKPTYLDAHYVHPRETFVGLGMFVLCFPLLASIMGPFHVAAVVITYVIYVQINIINHTFVDLPYFPFKTLNWITAKHHVHHIDMHRGNYATITLFYDKLFGTLD